MNNYLSQDQIDRLLAIEDLTKNPTHAIGIARNLLISALELKFGLKADVITGSPIVEKENNFKKLGYEDTEVTTGTRYCKYLSEDRLFRTQMTSSVPPTLESLAQDKDSWNEKLMVFPGMVYRRDVVDKTHVGQPHQMDVWYLQKERPMTREDLLGLVQVIVDQISNLVGQKIIFRCNETEHNYTDAGIEVEILYKGKWLEILECGLAGRKLLTQSGFGEEYSGLALGMGLDRFVMLVKNIEDIRSLRDTNPRVQAQMENLKKYTVVSKQPPIRRDMSIVVWKDTLLEELTEKVMENIGEKASWVEEITITTSTDHDMIPEAIRPRIGIKPGQENWLIKVILRDVGRSLTAEEANAFYTEMYPLIHQGTVGYSLSSKAA